MKRLLLLLFAASASAPAIAQHSGHAMPMPMPATQSGSHAGHQPARPAARPRPNANRTAACPRGQVARATRAGRTASAARCRPARPAAHRAGRRAAPAPANPHAGHAMPVAPSAGHDMSNMAPSGSQAGPAVRPADPHAGHNMQAMPSMQMQGHDMSAMPHTAVQPGTPAAPANPHAGHDMTAMPRQAPPQMPGHDMSNMPQGQSGEATQGHDMAGMAGDTPDPPIAPPPQAALGGPAHAADTVFSQGQMDEARDRFLDEHGSIRTYRVLIEQFEARIQNGRDGYAWDAQAWYGGATNRLWLKSEGEGNFGSSPEHAEVQALWSRALDPWFNLQAGVRYDVRPDPQRGYLVLGIEGLAPYWFEIDGAVFLSNKGDLSARFEGEYDLRITQRLILQPRVDLDVSLQDVPELRIGSGLSTAEAGLRLRYEIVPEFAPYVGVHYGRAFGDTARFRRAAGEDVGGWSFLVGVRTWF